MCHSVTVCYMVSEYGTIVFLKFYCEVVRSSDSYLYYYMLLQMFTLTQNILKYVNHYKIYLCDLVTFWSLHASILEILQISEMWIPNSVLNIANPLRKFQCIYSS